jgi:L-ascorbate metabolism protein UlaG (beta-lactamase superfamily)
MARLTYHGHSCFELATDTGSTVMFDPFLDDNPIADVKTADVEHVDFILCSHGHYDHFPDGLTLARRTGATMIGTFELMAFAEKEGVEKVHRMNVGGGFSFPFGYVKMTPAMHSGTVAGDSEGAFTTHANGFWIDLKPGHGQEGRKRLYHAGDTALLMDMQLLRGRVDVALLPIGDNFTMGPEDAARAVEFIGPRVVIPMHYNTWPPIAQDPNAFARRVGDLAEVVVLDPGETYDF